MPRYGVLAGAADHRLGLRTDQLLPIARVPFYQLQDQVQPDVRAPGGK